MLTQIGALVPNVSLWFASYYTTLINPQPTAVPTTTPLPPDGPLVPVGEGNQVCGPEVSLARRRRELAASGQGEEDDTATRSLAQSWDPDSCYYACKDRLGNPPTFVSE
jgi:hypothetical protein